MRELFRAPTRRYMIRLLVVALVIGAGGWAFGVEPVASIALGVIVIAVGVSWIVIDVDPPTPWPDAYVLHPGVRRDVDDLARALAGRNARVGYSAWDRVRRLAQRRLAAHGVDLGEPAHRARADALLGRHVATLLRRDTPPRTLGAITACLDALDQLSRVSDQNRTVS